MRGGPGPTSGRSILEGSGRRRSRPSSELPRQVKRRRLGESAEWEWTSLALRERECVYVCEWQCRRVQKRAEI